MKNKGFTLVEILGVLILLSVLTLIVSQVVIERIKENQEMMEKAVTDVVLTGARDYFYNNSNNFDKLNGEIYCLSYTTLKNSNYLDSDILNTIGDLKYLEDYYIEATYNGNSFNYKLSESCSSNIVYNSLYGGNDVEFLTIIKAVGDGSYLLGGYTLSSDGDITDGNNGSYDAFLLLTNYNGKIKWNKTYGGSSTDFLRSIVPTVDGGFLLGGNTGSNDGDVTDTNNGGNDFWIIKISSNGKIEWNKTYGGSGNESFSDMIPTPDGGYLLAGYTESNDGDVTDGNNGGRDQFIIKIDGNGEIEWNKTYGGSGNDYLVKVIPGIDGGYLLAGYTGSNDGDITDGNNGGAEVLLVKIDDNGEIEWDKTYGGSGNDYLTKIISTEDGNYLLGGYTISTNGDITDGNNGGNDIFIIKIKSNGEFEWDKTYGGSGNEILYDILESPKGGYLLAGFAESVDGDITDGNNGDRDGLIIKINNDGVIEWDKTYGGTSTDAFSGILPNGDGYIMAGSSLSNDGDLLNLNKGSRDYWLLTINKNGNNE